MTKVFMRPRSVMAGVVAGIAGAILIALCVYFAQVVVLRPGVPFTFVQLFQFDASVLVQKVAYTDPSYAILGALLHLLVSIGWGIGYAYMAERQAQLLSAPFRSGLGFGLVVYFAMQLVLVAGNLFVQPTPAGFGMQLVEHCLFFGVPIAYIVARMMRAA
jgi:hypothetical protein